MLCRDNDIQRLGSIYKLGPQMYILPSISSYTRTNWGVVTAGQAPWFGYQVTSYPPLPTLSRDSAPNPTSATSSLLTPESQDFVL